MLRLNNALPAFILLTFLWTLMLACPCAVPAQTAAGWKTEIVGKSVVLTPTDLAAGEDCRITIYPRVPMNGALITDFVDGFADREVAAQGGRLVGKPAPAAATNHSSAGTARQFALGTGRTEEALFFAVSPDQENVRVIGFICTADPAVLAHYQPQMLAVVREMTRQELKAATASGRGVVAENLPAAPDGLTPGGPIVPGIYVGSTVHTSDQAISARLRLYLYADGEFRVCNSAGEEINLGTGDSGYDPITGRLNIQSWLKMQNFRHGGAYCLYGRGADGKPCLMARETQTFGEWTTVLHYAGPPDRLSPKQEAAKKAADDAEARRYKYVTVPGKGVQASQIAAVLWQSGLVWIGNLPPQNEEFLALKDGTIHQGLEVPPDTLDVSLSRRKEPSTWGKWQKRGDNYYAAWPDKPGQYKDLHAGPVFPVKPGERLNGSYLKGVSGGDIATGGYQMFWGVAFRPDGRFLKSHSFSESTGYLALQNSGVVSGGDSGDNGSSTYTTSPQVTATSQAQRKGPARSGTYSFSSYTLILHYDDGRTEREPFFFIGGKRDFIYFEGATMNLQKSR